MDDELRRTLEYRGGADLNFELSLAQALKEGRLFDAALAARAAGRPGQAAELFERVEHHAEAAACWQEAGELRRALSVALGVSTQHGLYRSCARLAVEVACAMGDAGTELERFIRPWLDAGLKDTVDGMTAVDLGDLYARMGRAEEARQMYLMAVQATYDETARERLAALDNPNSQTLCDASEAALRGESGAGSSEPSMEGGGRPSMSWRPAPSLVLERGTVLAERYRVEQALGEGATARVFRARDLVLDEDVAIKIFTGTLDPARRARFKREIHLARKLSHPSIVRLYELIATAGVHGLTMEIVDGLPLDHWVDTQAASYEKRLDLMAQLVEGLGYAHEQDVVHRDIKPDNVLVTRDGRVKIMDFGIAKAAEQATITMSGALGGTPYYIAPEQIVSFREADHRADLYAVGVVMFQLFTGRLPFDGDTLLEVLRKHSFEPAPAARSINPALPESLDALIGDLLAKKPEDRVQTAAELGRRLAGITF